MMKTAPSALLRLFTLCLLSVLPVNSALAEGSTGASACCALLPPEHVLTTQGHGDIKVQPDAFRVLVTAEQTASSPSTAQHQVQEKMARLISDFRRIEKQAHLLKPLLLQTQVVQVHPVYDPKARQSKITGYIASNQLQVSATSLSVDQLTEVSRQLLEASANDDADRVDGSQFFVSDLADARNNALIAATRDARLHAESMAKALGVSLLGVQSAEGYPQTGEMPQPVYRMMAKAAPMAASADGLSITPPSVAVGEISISCDVTVHYLMGALRESKPF